MEGWTENGNFSASCPARSLKASRGAFLTVLQLFRPLHLVFLTSPPVAAVALNLAAKVPAMLAVPKVPPSLPPLPLRPSVI